MRGETEEFVGGLRRTVLEEGLCAAGLQGLGPRRKKAALGFIGWGRRLGRRLLDALFHTRHGRRRRQYAQQADEHDVGNVLVHGDLQSVHSYTIRQLMSSRQVDPLALVGQTRYVRDMAPIIRIATMADHVGATVTLRGWVYNFRSSGKIAFLQLRDGSGFSQVVCTPQDVPAAAWEQVGRLTLESSVICTGIVAKHPKREEYELHGRDLSVVQFSQEYPIGKKEHGPDFLLDLRHLWLRSPRQWAIQRIRDTVIRATYDFFHREGFIKIDSPVLTPAACEGTTTLFAVPYFDMGHAYLTQSGQLYLEAAIAAHGRVFDFGPVFRAEKSKTRRHLTEFWMMDAEMAFCEHAENLQIQEHLITAMVQAVLRDNRGELAILERNAGPLEQVQPPFPRITHAEAVARLREQGSAITAGSDLGAEDETLLAQDYDRPVFVEKYPAAIKAFYMKRDPDNPALALCADLIAPEGFGEIIGGSQREDDHDTLLARIREHKLPEDAFGWYLDLRKYGSVPHSGFGYGLERIVAWLSGTHHVRETIPFPRLINRLTP